MMSTHSSNLEITWDQPGQPVGADAGRPHSEWRQVWRTIVLCCRKNLAIAVATLLLLLVALPVILLMVPAKYYDAASIAELFRNLMAIPVFAISTVALVLSAGQMFTFLHSRTACDVFHALPVRRPTLFAGRFLGGFLIVFVPQVLTFGCVLLIRLLPGYQILDRSLVIQTVSAFLLISLAVYAVAVLAFVLTGTSFDAMVLLLMFHSAYPGTLYTIDSVVSKVLPGFSMENYGSIVDMDRYLLFSPVGELLKVVFQPMRLTEVLWWIALILLTSLGCLLIDRRRPSEFAGRPLAYRLPFLIVRFLATLVAGLIFGYLYAETYATLAAFIFSAAVGSLAIHTLIEAVLSRGFRNFRRSLIGYGVFVILFAVGCAVVATGFFGYDIRLPETEKIIEVRLTPDSDRVYFDEYGAYQGLVFTDPENITALRAMNDHWLEKMQALVQKPYSLRTNDRLDQNDNGKGSGPTRIVYKLSTGTVLVRTVFFNYNEEPYASLYNQIRKTDEYKRQHYRYYFKSDSVLSDVRLADKDGITVLTLNQANDGPVLAKILAALQDDLLLDADGKTGGRLLGYLELTVSFDFTGPAGNQGYTATRQRLTLTDAFARTSAVLDDSHLLAGLGTRVAQYEAAYITTSRSGEGSLLDLLTKDAESGHAGPCFFPGQGFTSLNLPLLHDSQVFLKIEDPDLIRLAYREGRDVESAEDDGYLVILAAAEQVRSDGHAAGDLLVLYLPAGQVPEALLRQLKSRS
jgi:hypothetical protein